MQSCAAQQLCYLPLLGELHAKHHSFPSRQFPNIPLYLAAERKPVGTANCNLSVANFNEALRVPQVGPRLLLLHL